MRNTRLFASRNARRGDILIFLLIAFVIAALIVGYQSYKKKHAPDPDTTMDMAPWKELQMREKSEKPPTPISEKQAKIPDLVQYEAYVYMPGTTTPRGDVTLIIASEEQIGGSWSGTFSNDKNDNFDVQAGRFEGKFFPGKIYSDDKGQDLSKLYFLAKGKFVIHKVTGETKNYRIFAGDIYVRGWLSPDLSLTGEIIITTDEETSETFAFKADRPEKKSQPQMQIITGE
jgi:hypothetical protein